MGWKTINGHRYYYKPKRDGGRVKTTYFGARESGLLISLLELEDRAEREAEREQRRAEKEEFETEEKAVAEWFEDGHRAIGPGARSSRGQSLTLGSLLAGWNRSAEFELALDDWSEFGLSRFSASRGLDELERAGLVSVGRMPGRSPVVTILEAKSANP
jgi:hypothetical protein